METLLETRESSLPSMGSRTVTVHKLFWDNQAIKWYSHSSGCSHDSLMLQLQQHVEFSEN